MKELFFKLCIAIYMIVFTMTACSSPGEQSKPLTRDDIVKMNLDEYLGSRLNDPDSYEFVELKIMDSVLYKDNIEYRRNYFIRQLEYEKDNLERQLDYKKTIPSMYDENEVLKIRGSIDKNNKILSGIDSLEIVLDDMVNNVALYTYYLSFRATNSFGAKVLNEYILQTDPAPDYEIINMTDDQDQIILNPNDFPGYREMITKY